jgi:peptidoglycan hydrolase-like protein with peptidoglycan-binding domain
MLALSVFTTVAALALPSGAAAASSPAGQGSGGAGVQSARRSAQAQHSVAAAAEHLGQRVLKQGMSGHDVRVLQAYLTRAGYPTPVVGTFGPITRRNVIAFERASGFRPDGVVSLAVATSLRTAVAANATGQGGASLGAPPSASGPVASATLNADGTVTAPSDAPIAVQEVIAAANKIAFKPYVWGGGHGRWNDSGYDCSGSVSYALHGAGLLSSSLDSTGFESYGRGGAGQWITIYANGGHAYMNVAGLWFDTAAQSSSNSNDRWSTTRASSRGGFVVRHPAGL